MALVIRESFQEGNCNVAVLRALRVHPKFLIADEISTMLDAITQVQIWEFLLSYCEENKVGLVLVTHSKALQDRLATRVVSLTS